MSFDEDYGIGDAQQFFGTVAPWAQDIPEEIYSNEGRNYPLPFVSDENYYSNEGRNYPTPESTQGLGGSPINSSMIGGLGRLFSNVRGIGSKAGQFASSPQGLMAIVAALAALADRRGSSGGGTSMGMPAPRQYTRSVEQGAYGPLVRYAAQGGLMQAYANGGKVQMEDGGFVMTKKAVDGADGFDGMKEIIPEARPIVGPGTGTSDDIPAVIHGKHGKTPARVSNGEMYIPPGRSTKGLYALMKSLERKA